MTLKVFALAFCLLAVEAMWTVPSQPFTIKKQDTPVAELMKLLVDTTSTANKNACGSALMSLLTKQLGSPQFMSLLMYSGKKLNDLGDYLSCQKSPDSRYVLTGMLIEPYIYLRFGVCYPKECTVEALSEYKPQFAKFFSGFIGEPLPPEFVAFYDVHEENSAIANYGAGYVFFWCLTGLLILLAVVATVLDEIKVFSTDKVQGNPALKALQCFSLGQNLKSFFKALNPVDPNLEVFNGIRIISMCWIIMGHCYTVEFSTPTYNMEEVFNTIKDGYEYTFLKSATLAVDVFFMLSGFFAAVSFFKIFKNPQARTPKTFLTAYLYRYLRLFPMMLFTILFVLFVMGTIKDQPAHPQIRDMVDTCRDSWYWNFLYVNNFQTFKNVCNDWTWYLMNDMQFYILAPFIILPFYYSKTLGNVILGSLSLISIVITACIYSYYELHSSFVVPNKNDYFTIYYTKPYCRIFVYIMGIYLYILYKETKESEDHTLVKRFNAFASSWGKYVLYILGLVFMYFSITVIHYFDKYPDSWSQGLATFHELAYRPVFILGLMFVLYPTLIGKGDFMRSVFGHPIFNPLGKITYGAYMLHIIIADLVLVYTLSGHYWTPTWIWMNFFTVLSLSYLFSFAISIVYESPVIQLIKTFLERGRAKSVEAANSTEVQEPLINKSTAQ